ncbi:MAG TPA: hypothetical protein ENN99_14820 [Chloroflexi bacterium]|nr:hypothetical protein [Chloroflexota bacterium]
MMEEPTMPAYARPGRALHLAFIASILFYVLVVELGVRLLEPFAGFAPDFNSDQIAFGALRLGFIVLGAISLVMLSVVWQRPRLIKSVGSIFIVAYASLDVLATLGLILFLLGGLRLDFYSFAVPALAGHLLLLTQGHRWDELVDELAASQRDELG